MIEYLGIYYTIDLGLVIIGKAMPEGIRKHMEIHVSCYATVGKRKATACKPCAQQTLFMFKRNTFGGSQRGVWQMPSINKTCAGNSTYRLQPEPMSTAAFGF